MQRLILVRHSLPRVVPDIPARNWSLSDIGRQRCAVLAQQLATFSPAVIATSVEPKASETAQLVAGTHGVPCEAYEGLHEHERSEAGFLETREFEQAIQDLFARPDDLVFGRETARQA